MRAQQAATVEQVRQRLQGQKILLVVMMSFLLVGDGAMYPVLHDTQRR